MSDLDTRLSRCFLAVFPGLKESDLAGASQSSLAQWDSVAHVTLLAAVAEEFGIDLDEDSFESLVSYRRIEEFVAAHAR